MCPELRWRPRHELRWRTQRCGCFHGNGRPSIVVTARSVPKNVPRDAANAAGVPGTSRAPVESVAAARLRSAAGSHVGNTAGCDWLRGRKWLAGRCPELRWRLRHAGVAMVTGSALRPSARAGCPQGVPKAAMSRSRPWWPGCPQSLGVTWDVPMALPGMFPHPSRPQGCLRGVLGDSL